MHSIEQRITQIRTDHDHGSRWLVQQALLILRDLAQQQGISEDEHMCRLYAAAHSLAQARPSMAALSGAVSRVCSVRGGPPAIARAAHQLLEEYTTATESIATHAQPFIKGRILTCSLSGTVLDVLVACRQRIESIVLLEGRPRYEGRTMAQELHKQGLSVTLITDAQAAIFLPLCDMVVVGADSILAGGDVLNKAGTALLAWTAHGEQIPFYVLCETLKISPRHWSEQPEQLSTNLALLEEKGAQEVWEQATPGITVRNFYFDHTPSRLVSAWITERGVLQVAQIAAIAASVADNEKQMAERSGTTW